MYQNRLLILSISLSVLFGLISASPVFEPSSENIVDDNVPDDTGFERANDGTLNDGFPDMNDFNFERETGLAGQSKDQEAANQSGEQMDRDEDGPPGGPQSARERPMLGDMNKATAEEQEGNEEDGSGEITGRPRGPRGGSGEYGNKKPYQDGESENSARSLDQFEPFDKETADMDKNDGFNENSPDDQPMNRPEGGPNHSGEEDGPRGGHHLPIPPPLQIDEPIIVNGGPGLPMPMHGRPPMVGVRSNSEEAEGESGEEELEPGMREYMNQWISNFERDPSLLNALSNSVSNINYGFGDSKR